MFQPDATSARRPPGSASAAIPSVAEKGQDHSLDIFGPNSPVVEAMLDRASRLDEDEGRALWVAHLKERQRESLFHAALSAVVDASHVHRRQTQMRIAEQAGRAVVTVFPGSSLGDAIGGYVGRLAEALVVADRVDAASIAPLARPWLTTIGPFEAIRDR